MHRVVLLFWLLFVQVTMASPSYLDCYRFESQFALAYYKDNLSDFEFAAKGTNLSVPFIFSVIAPELSQYNVLTDAAEVFSLKVLYVQGGKSYANFSIGLFQMKPAFVELLEANVAKNDYLKSLFPDFVIAGQNLDAKGQRAERVKRLECIDWQMMYLKVFCLLVQKNYPMTNFMSENNKLRFYAAVYNIGFRPISVIYRERKKALFPRLGVLKFRYEDVAVCFFNNLRNQSL